MAPGQPQRSDRKEDGGFDRETRHGIGGDDFPQQPVRGECRAQHQADPQLAERPQGEHGNARGGDGNRRPLPPLEPLVQDETAEQDVGERIQIIAEARRQDVTARDRLDVEQPVGGDQDCGEDEHANSTPVRDRLPDLWPAAREHHE